jgi:hypothetical protein
MVLEERGYHTACDLQAFRALKGSLNKEQVHQKLVQTGYSNVPNQKTSVCPTPETTEDYDSSSQQLGQDTMWFVENVASRPVRVAWKDTSASGTSMEYSPVHRKLLAKDDPEAIMTPSQWKAIHAVEGEVFVVRDTETEEVLLEHRVGLIPIGQREKEELPKGVTVPLKPDVPAREQIRAPLAQTFDWSTCNVVAIGFRNEAMQGDLHGFWVDTFSEGDCTEHFKFQLGTNPHPNNFAFDIDSNTKFEMSYMGHSFVFRSAKTGELVDSYTLHPTLVRDCPGRNNALTSAVAGAEEAETVQASIGLNSTIAAPLVEAVVVASSGHVDTVASS